MKSTAVAATAFAALLAAAPVGAFAASGPGAASGQSATDAPAGVGSTAGGPQGGASADTGSAGMPSMGHASASGHAGHHQRLSSNDLQGVQQQLQSQGYYADGQVDGRWGPQTRRAVQSFQQAKGLPATGHLDAQTLGALGVPHQGG